MSFIRLKVVKEHIKNVHLIFPRARRTQDVVLLRPGTMKAPLVFGGLQQENGHGTMTTLKKHSANLTHLHVQCPKDPAEHRPCMQTELQTVRRNSTWRCFPVLQPEGNGAMSLS